jgi:hypothetical protein
MKRKVSLATIALDRWKLTVDIALPRQDLQKECRASMKKASQWNHL